MRKNTQINFPSLNNNREPIFFIFHKYELNTLSIFEKNLQVFCSKYSFQCNIVENTHVYYIREWRF